MVGIVVASHGSLASGMLDALELLSGEQKAITAIGLQRGDSPDAFVAKVKEAINAVDEGDGVLVLVDLFGGTPSNAVAQLLGRDDLNAVAGVNLPMLLSVVFARDEMDLKALTEEAVRASCDSVVDIRRKLFDTNDDEEEF
ncbi:PTS sugar transporter subunit IIA [Olsenella sp. Marseille-P4559]|uniref:PTS sugar transporter subunit IIA n=1 Tax=Olsenella sp. Marseille-P4559 TaxID=2364795 RepID=UPI00103035AF|nr:PTS sugar transporter subunit IIA [Olsenella sp. Marseille-P4559]